MLSVSFSIRGHLSKTKTVCAIVFMKKKAWLLFSTHFSDLHRALANLARATLESVVQER